MSDPVTTNNTSSAARLLPDQRRYLLLGERGAGMTALAQILEDAGHFVVGADRSNSTADVASGLNVSPLRTTVDWSPEALPTTSVDVCVFTPALSRDCPILNKVRMDGVPTQALHECIADLFREKRQLCVAGTHGKTTTSAMLSWILDQTHCEPSCFVGGEIRNMNRSGVFGDSDWAVLESCEFSNSFRHLKPHALVLTGIERDHFDCFPDKQSEDEAFRNFARQLSTNGTLIINGNCDRTNELMNLDAHRAVTFGIQTDDQKDFDWTATDLNVSAYDTSFSCHHRGITTRVQLAVPGRHSVANAIAAIAAAAVAGIAPEASAAALRTFSGVRRRFEIRGRPNGIVMIDDYAHHPSAIRETVKTARAVFPGQRIVLVFEPHQAVRTLALFSDFVNSLQLADETLLLPVFPARETLVIWNAVESAEDS